MSFQDDVKYSQEIHIAALPFIHPLHNGFGPGSQLFFIVKMDEHAERYHYLLREIKWY
jgi:hypothetical protein